MNTVIDFHETTTRKELMISSFVFTYCILSYRIYTKKVYFSQLNPVQGSVIDVSVYVHIHSILFIYSVCVPWNHRNQIEEAKIIWPITMENYYAQCKRSRNIAFLLSVTCKFCTPTWNKTNDMKMKEEINKSVIQNGQNE